MKRLISETPCAACGKEVYIENSKMYCAGCDRIVKGCVCPALLSQNREYR